MIGLHLKSVSFRFGLKFRERNYEPDFTEADR